MQLFPGSGSGELWPGDAASAECSAGHGGLGGCPISPRSFKKTIIPLIFYGVSPIMNYLFSTSDARASYRKCYSPHILEHKLLTTGD